MAAESLTSLLETRRILLCVGVGGVGKTTTAAALSLAAARRGKRVLCLTIDPARRLAQSLGIEWASTEASTIDHALLAKVAFGDRAEGLVAVVRAPSLALDDLRLPAEPLIVVIEAVEKPGNIGAVLRSADGAGVDAVIAASPRTDLANPNVIRASAGTIFAV